MNSEGGSDSESMVFEYADDDSCLRPRKRQRLTHLSPGEKLQRRKLKNRVAAQAARDRKKAYMDELEEIVAQLQSDNKRLAQENTALRQQQQCPNCHNNNKNIPDSTAVKVEPMSSLISTLTEPEATSKSAVLSPQQKERLQALLVLMMTSCSLIFPKNSSNSVSSSSKTPSQMEPLDLTQQTLLSQEVQTIFQQWWGPQQSAWNPTETL